MRNVRVFGLMTLAPLLLVACALWWQKHETPRRRDDGVFRLSIERTEISAITLPSEIADGYDTQVKLVLNYSGARPKWWDKRDYYMNFNGVKSDVLFTQNSQTKNSRVATSLW